MNFTEVVAAVIGITGRPDKIVATQLEVNAAINNAVIGSSFLQDKVETTVLINPGETYSGSIPVTSLPLFRRIDYIRATPSMRFLVQRQPLNVIVNSVVQRDIYWMGGIQINWVSSILTPSFEIGYFTYPPQLSDALPTHWLLDISPYFVIDRAAARIFQSIGDNPSFQTHEIASLAAFQILKNDIQQGATPVAV